MTWPFSSRYIGRFNILEIEKLVAARSEILSISRNLKGNETSPHLLGVVVGHLHAFQGTGVYRRRRTVDLRGIDKRRRNDDRAEAAHGRIVDEVLPEDLHVGP